MKGKSLWIFGAAIAVAASAFFLSKRGGGDAEIQYKYGKVERGELVRSISASGQLVALTKVDIRSKAGGKIIRLAVDEGTVVKKGDLIAVIDPEDTRTVVDQARADLTGAQARAESARINAQLESVNRANAVREAEVALQTARTRLARIQTTSGAQPKLSQSELENARASLNAQETALRQLEQVDVPRLRKEAQVGADRARAEMDAAQAEYERYQRLLRQEFVSQSELERVRSSYEGARASNANAQERLRTVEHEIDALLQSQRARVNQSRASLRTAEANQSRISTSKRDYEEAQQSVRSAELDLVRARNDIRQAQIRNADQRSAQANIVRSQVSLSNAQKQLSETTVVAPRDGVVTKKYLEEGTIIPAGTSTFSQGTAIVEISDVTEMYVECAVDEADIAQVREGQPVRVIVEAFPGSKIRGVVDRVNPAAQTEQNITAIKVRVRVTDVPDKVQLKPGMNSTCEFLTMQKRGALVVPSQAIQRDGGKTMVRVKGDGPKPASVEVKLGEEGNEGFEVVSGLNEGQEVVIAEINLSQIREIQQKMQEAQQGGGLAGGRPGGAGGGSRSGMGGGGGTGSRSGGGMGGGGR